MTEPVMKELEFLVELLTKYPTDSLRKIAKSENIDYYRLKRLYDKYYGRYITVNAFYNLRLIGLKSYVAFLSVPSDKLMEITNKMAANPFISYINPAFGFKNGLSVIIYIPADQTDRIDDLLSRYSQDYEYYEVRAYPYTGDDNFGRWTLSHDYAVLMDILKINARTPITEIARRLRKTRPTVKFMIKRLKKEGILVNFAPVIDMNIHDRGVIGLTKTLNEDVLERFREYEITVGVLLSYGYLLEWFFSSKDDLGSKILEFSNYVDKLLIEYFDTFKELNDMKSKVRFSKMVKKDGSGYHSILDF